jgi:hypothetical protein
MVSFIYFFFAVFPFFFFVFDPATVVTSNLQFYVIPIKNFLSACKYGLVPRSTLTSGYCMVKSNFSVCNNKIGVEN